MSEPNFRSPVEPVSSTPAIKEISSETGSDGLHYGSGQDLRPGIRQVNGRAEIDTSPPFASVMEAVTRFGGHGPWVNPLYKFGDNYNIDEEFDIKRVEEQTAELEKDLIVKELETLDVLEELTTTKRIVEELKRQLQEEALKCFSKDQITHNLLSPNIKEMNSPSPCPGSSPDLILMELKRAKLNLGKTMTDLGAIQSSVECLTKKMRREKELVERTRESGSSRDGDGEATSCLKRTAEMRWVAAKKMGEAARAAEAVALAEIGALSGGENSAGQFLLSEPDKMSFNFRVQAEPTGWSRQRLALADAMLRLDEAHASKIAIMMKLKEASDEVKLGKLAMDEALNRVNLANQKQIAAEEAMNTWITGSDPPARRRHAPIPSIDHGSPRIDDNRRHLDYRLKPASKTTVSMRDVLSKKQVASEHNETQKVALSDMLQALRDDLNFPSKVERDRDVAGIIDVNKQNTNQNHGNHKQFWSQRKKFGFIQISLPLTKPSKKKAQNL